MTLSLERFGLAVGHATDDGGATGCTVIRGVGAPHRAAVAVIGRATATREISLLEPGHLVERVDAILLTGGSAYGLDAAAGVMRWMESRGRGFPVGAGVVPIVPAAALFDLGPLGRFDARPTAAMAEQACDAATTSAIGEGAVGAGTGLTVGKVLGRSGAMKGGVGLAMREADGCAAMALVAVNAFGDIRGADGGIIAGARRPGGGFADSARVLAAGGAERAFGAASASVAPNTTLAVVAVDAALSQSAATPQQLIDSTLEIGRGTLLALDNHGTVTVHSTERACSGCGRSFQPLDPKIFSYNSAQGWCPQCRGFGELFYLPEVERGARADAIEESWWGWQEGKREPCPSCAGARLNEVARAVRLPVPGAKSKFTETASAEPTAETPAPEAEAETEPKPRNRLKRRKTEETSEASTEAQPAAPEPTPENS